ncbi:hypothetical protein C8R44DRAFT_881022 [Mycena epipterygia]|nr:hypothetical protein C8R44DRAFT_881022 [Mycena epipterygia]
MLSPPYSSDHLSTAVCAASQELVREKESSPARRLPAETLVRIFASCDSFNTDLILPWDIDISRLAQEPLLTVSRVCSQWHTIAIGTPSLWAAIEISESGIWSNTSPRAKAMELLARALERSAPFPLNISVIGETSLLALSELVKHSKRWRTVKFRCPRQHLQALAMVRGKLDLLEVLDVRSVDGLGDEMAFFEVAPRLRHLVVSGSVLGPVLATGGRLPLQQLHTLTCINFQPDVLALTVSSMSSLSHGTKVSLDVNFSGQRLRKRVDMRPLPLITPILSTITSLSISVKISTLVARRLIADSVPLYDDVLASLTLPHLQDLTVKSYWQHTAFLALSARSAFHSHLLSLDLSYSDILEAELFESISELLSLERLAISDSEYNPSDGGDPPVITDTVFIHPPDSDARRSNPPSPPPITQLPIPPPFRRRRVSQVPAVPTAGRPVF